MQEKIISILKSKPVKTFIWQTANGFILLLITVGVSIQPDIIDPKATLIISALIAALNYITKLINRKYL